ncbi:hypothetical protein HII31_12013 [Pseudocercospora fuligena]|uniref:Uncharacterized protein n=1 Tax=Pseudocercospora fuligena TaxID=685502 RepID=A0A8H6R8Z7_9PEZI|nr:hypothetical protein HII31_12013 [Pseudocercospora fuligena]
MATRLSFIVLSFVFLVQSRHLHQYKHEAVVLERRQVGPPIQASPTSTVTVAATSDAPILTYITPSPGAAAIAITEESQLVTSYVPQYTLCELPPQAVFPVTPALPTTTMTAPWRNYSISLPPGNGTCTTIYSPTQTMVCATTLTGLVQKYTVSDCAQDISFSTEYGYVLASPTITPNLTSEALATITPQATVQRLTTFYLAPWQAVTAGSAPEEVTLKVCATYANGTEECIRQYEVWHTSLVTESATRTTSVNISTTIHGTSQVIVETFAANITEAVTTFRLSTDMEFEYATEIVTTDRSSVDGVITAPTSYITRTVENATPIETGSDDITTTRTSTIRRTSTTTVYDGTTTATLPTVLADDTPTESVDWVSMLGIPTARKE